MEYRYDILGNVVNLGDDVIIIEPRRRSFVNGTIVKFTPTGFQVKYNSGVCQGVFFVTQLVKGKMQ